MPPNTALRTFIEALNTGQSNITVALNTLMEESTRWRGNVNDITVSPALSQWLKDRFAENGMSAEDIAHIDNQWPMPQKLELRTHVLAAIDVGRPMNFSWTLTGQPQPWTQIVWPPPHASLSAPVTVVFHSPGAGVVLSDDTVQISQ